MVMSKVDITASIINQLSHQAQKKLIRAHQPQWINPMLATLTSTYFSDKNFLYEHKWDGERILTFKQGSDIRLMTRNKKLANNAYPDIIHALQNQTIDNFIIDGEVIAMEKGVSDFGLLQNRMHETFTPTDQDITLYYCLFDVMHIGSYNTTQVPLLDRKALLHNMLSFIHPLRYTEHILEYGEEYFKQACKKGWEGIIAKEIHSTYVQVRSRDWLKFKCINQQEFVIGGYTDPQRSRINFGALLVGYYDNGTLIYAGKVGTGFTTQVLEQLGEKLFSLEQNRSSFVDTQDIPHKGVHWIKPQLVAEIKFSEWTDYGKLRHPRYVGLRRDKNPHDVIKEKAQDIIR
jgi:bifunctional non-homologous end joining protein LigD